MKKLWQDIASHRVASALFFFYWLATVLAVPFAWKGGIPLPIVALLLSNSLIAGALISWWRRPTAERRSSLGYRMQGGILVGALVAEVTNLVIKGGTINEIIGWMRGWPHFGQWGEVLEFTIVVGILGVFLGFLGCSCSAILSHRHGAGAKVG